MKKQNGFSQIFVMVIMLILAIALPVTANLVKKVQDNRSSAATETIYQGLICTGPQKGSVVCQGSTTFKCTEEISTNGPVWKKVADDCSCTRFNDSGSCTAMNGCAWGYVGSSMSCHAITSTCSATNCTACGVDRCTAVGCAWGYVGSSLSCSKASTPAASTSTGGTSGGSASGIPSNVSGTATNITTKYIIGANCIKAGGICGDFNSTPAPGSTCQITGVTAGTIVNGLCPGDTTVKCCVASTATPVSEPVAVAPAAPVVAAPDCSDQGSHCYGEAYKTGCTGTKLATHNNCADKANYCAGEYYAAAEAQNNKDIDGDICGNPLGCIGTKDCTPVVVPTAVPTVVPTAVPTAIPTAAPTAVPVAGYIAPKLNMLFAISGVKKIDTCFGDLKFKVSITKNGSSVATTNEVTATIVDNKFNTKFGDQVFKITDFALTNDYALTDKIKITIGSSRKILATIYGKNNQDSGFPALNNSTILVSDLVGKTLNFYEYPVLNGDIGKEGSLGVADNVVNGFDFAFMKSEWGKTCSTGQNLNADLNGDCRVDTFDLQILKNAMAEQLAQKTD